MSKLARSLACVLALGAFAPVARAHGGDDHEHAAPAPRASSGERRNAEAVSETFEAVLSVPAAEPGQPHRVTLYLSDWATNAPTEQAKVALALPDLALEVDGVAVEGRRGVYELTLTPGRAGTFAGILSIATADVSDLLAFSDIRFGPDPTVADAPRTVPRAWLLGALGAVALLLAGSIVLLARSRRARRPGRAAAIGLVAAALVHSPGARSHGGEEHDHGAPAGAGTPATVAVVPKEAQFRFGILTTVARSSTFPRRFTLDGRVTAPPHARAEVIALQPGRVIAPSGPVPRVGDAVRAGQPLLVLEGAISAGEHVESLRALADARARLAAHEAEQRAARRDWERAEALPEIVSQRERDAVAARLETAKAAAASASREVDVLSGSGSRTARTVLTSPIDGVVTRSDLTLGEGVEAGRVFFTIVDPARLWIRAEIPERDAAMAVHLAGATARIVAGGVRQAALPAKFVSASPSVDPDTRTVPAFFDAEGGAGRLVEGMLVEVHVETAEQVEGFVVPASSVVTVNGRALVFVHVHPEEFAPREVTVGLGRGDEVELFSGVAEGERVVVSGTYQVRAALLAGSSR